jgi:hypothetical protein
MSWVSYTENINDDTFVHDSDYVKTVLKQFADGGDFDIVNHFMVEFNDGSFIRFERMGIVV